MVRFFGMPPDHIDLDLVQSSPCSTNTIIILILSLALKAIKPDVHIGLASFVDFPTYPWGDAASGDYPYKKEIDITNDFSAILTKIEELETYSGVDWPESQLHALKEIVDGSESMNFRDAADVVILLWTDASFHFGGDGSSYPGPSFAEAITALHDKNAKVVGLLNGGDSTDITYVAQQTGALAPLSGVKCNAGVSIAAGQPIVCPASGTLLENVIPALVTGAIGCKIEDVDYNVSVYLFTTHSFLLQPATLTQLLLYSVKTSYTYSAKTLQLLYQRYLLLQI